MHSLAKLLLVSFSFFLPAFVGAQQSSGPTQAPQRDPQAIALLQQAVAAMASSAPTDSSATGTVTIVEGSSTETGSIKILTLGPSQTSETITLTSEQRVVVYANGNARETAASQSSSLPSELAISDQCPDFPLPVMLAALNNPDEAFHYVAAETLDGTAVQHIQFWNSFTSNPHQQNLAPFSTKDVWIDSASGLPLKISYFRRAGSGAVPAVPVEVFFSNYTKINGVLYPFQINKSYNGTPWEAITIQSVSFNTGLTTAQFQVE
jgi:hypothetical protein